VTGDGNEGDDGSSATPAKKIASPEATGGAGVNFEARFAGVVLARLLRGDHVEGLGLPVERVQFQRRFAGHLLDDVVAEGTDALGRLRIIEYQAKRRLSPAPSDDEFKETVARCIQAVQADGDDGEIARQLRRFGLVANPSGPLADLSRVTEIARAHDSAGSFLDVVRVTANAGVVQRLEQLRTTVTNCLKDEQEDEFAAAPLEAKVDGLAWRVARAMWIWQADAEPEGQVVLAAQDRLADLALVGTEPSDVFDKLVTLARDWAPNAGSIDVAMLRVALEEKGVALSAAPARAAAFNALLAESERALDTGVVLLGGQLRLPREQLRASVVDAVRQNNATLLRGRAGVGKSMLARLVAEDLRSEGAVVVGINLAGRTGSLAALEDELRVRLADGLAGAPIGSPRLLLIDGAEQAQTDSGRLLRAIFEAIPTASGAAPAWRLLVTGRDEAEGTIAGLVSESFGAPDRIVVGELSDAEVARVVNAFPALEPLQRNVRAVALLLRRPYLVELLIRSTAVMGLPPDVVGEEDLMDVVTLRLVRRDNGGLIGRGAPDARSDIYLALAQDAIANNLPSSLAGTDAEARAGLSSDDVIAPVRLSWRFAHDVLTDYAVATRLLEPEGDTLLAAAPAPRRLLRGVRLRMQRELADALNADRLVEAWTRTVAEAEQLAQTDGPRWRDVPFEALLHLGAAREALGILRPVLVADGSLLSQLVDVADRLARLETTTEEWAPVALDTSLTGPVVDLLGALGDQVPDPCVYRAARLVHRHLIAGFAYRGAPDHGLEGPQHLPEAVITWAGEATYGDLLELCLGCLGFLGEHLGASAESFLLEHARSRPHEIAELVESRWGARALAQARPALLLNLAGYYYLGHGLSLDGSPSEPGRKPPSRGLTGDLDGEGVRDHDPRQALHISPFPLGNNQANPQLGPFLALLEADEVAGLALVGAVVDAATDARTRTESRWSEDDPDVRLRLQMSDRESAKDFVGPPSVWCWHRRTTVGPGPAQSSLMALRQWASAKRKAGSNLASVRDGVLSTGTSLAFPAVAWFVLLEHLDDVTDEMDPFLVHPLVWHLEIGRVVQERGLALSVPEVTRVDWQVSQVAMQLVLRGNETRRAALARLGDRLMANAETENVEEHVAQRWASELEIENYRAGPHAGGGIEITVEYDPAVVSALTVGAETAQRGLRSASLMYRAAGLRDGEGELGEAEQLWREVVEHVSQSESETDLLYRRADLACAAAAAVVRAACAGVDIGPEVLSEAVATLLHGASETAKLAPPRLEDLQAEEDRDVDDDDWESSAPQRFVRQNVWPDGMDRSAASGLSLLLAVPEALARSGVDDADIVQGLIDVAASPFDETRERLVIGLLPLWDVGCDSSRRGHGAIIAVANRLLETAGYGPMTRFGYGYPQATLASPVAQVLRDADDLVLDVDSAAFAIRLLGPGVESACEHAEPARQLVDALIAYDEKVWPERYARRHYIRTSRWRLAVDHAIARRVLLGDTDSLRRRLELFAPIGEELTGLLEAMVEEAHDAELAVRLHAVWPLVLDGLLPGARDLRASDSGREHPYHRDVDELDDALLLVPGDGVDFWPWSETVKLAGPWFRAFKGRPDRADRAIKFAGRLFGIESDEAALLVLTVLGDDAGRVKRDSQLAVAFLQLALRNPPAEPLASQARTLLDALAREGDEYALRVQRELENG
jgi:hypothetical protein